MPAGALPYDVRVLTQESSARGAQGRPAPASRPPATSLFLKLSTPGAFLMVVAGSAAVGVVIPQSPLLATAHQVAVLGVLLAVAIFSSRVDVLLAVTVYAALSDVLWRTANARGPYEAAKYAAIIGLGAIAIRFVRRRRGLTLAVTFLLLLVPGAIVGTLYFGPAGVREYLTANLAALVVIAVGVVACPALRLSQAEMRGLYAVALSPLISVAANATRATIESKSLTFSDSANFAAAGGFGPNQVSATLCFGALLCVLILLQREVGWRMRSVVLAAAVWLVGQAVLTFSRGGIFGLLISLVAVLLVAMIQSGQRVRSIFLAAVLAAVALQILSWAGAFTGGESEKRFSSTDSSNRVDIGFADLRLFSEHPIFGAGVGVSTYERPFHLRPVAPHTEYTRMLAEHGIFGVAALLLLAVMCVRTVRRSGGWYRMAAVGLIVMSLLQMLTNATRMGSIGLAIALAAILEDPT